MSLFNIIDFTRLNNEYISKGNKSKDDNKEKDGNKNDDCNKDKNDKK